MEKRPLIIVGASGQMGSLIVERATALGHKILFAVVGPEDETTHVHSSVNGEYIPCIKINKALPLLEKCDRDPMPIIIDFTHKSIINKNYEKIYENVKLPLIVGTIGIDKKDIKPDFPVIICSPNILPEIGRIMKIFDRELIPGFLKGISYGITESHPGPDPAIGYPGKTEFSGTADKMSEALKKLGGKQLYLTSIRDPKIQSLLGIKDRYLSAHAWHTYHFMSPRNMHGTEKILNLCKDIVSKAKLGATETGMYLDHGDRRNEITRWINNFEVRVTWDDYNVRLSHNVNGRDGYIDWLFNFFLPQMEKYVDKKQIVLKDTFDF